VGKKITTAEQGAIYAKTIMDMQPVVDAAMAMLHLTRRYGLTWEQQDEKFAVLYNKLLTACRAYEEVERG
jgi:hypothetical protein